MRICSVLLLLVSVNAFCDDDALIANEIHVNLKSPTYQNGILFTTSGGVIQNEDIRIQAKSIQYTRKGAVHKIEAEGDLLIQYKKRIFVGSELQYDFNEKRGVVYDAKTSVNKLYIGAEMIELNPDGSFEASQAFITTCENKEATWDIRSGTINITRDGQVDSRNTTFRLFGVPVFWLPSFKMNLNKPQDPIFDYNLSWDSGMGPRASVSYQFYSWKDFSMFGRLEYRWGVGWGGSWDAKYLSSESNTRFVMRNYLAKDRLEPAPNSQRRYRVQGDFEHISENNKSLAAITWDKYSDVRMQSDFKSDDPELNPAKKTVLYLRHREDPYTASLLVRPRLNPFESIKQDLPTGFFTLRPIELGSTGIYSTSLVKASYLDFAYSTQLIKHLASYHAGRVELREKLFRPFQVGPVTCTPIIGGDGIFYSHSPSSHAKWVGLLAYGFKAETRAIRQFTQYKHQIEPYAEYKGLSKPTVSPDHHYIFSIQDGQNKLNQLKAGIRSLLFSKKRAGKEALFHADLYANAFFADFAIPQVVPYGYLDFTWNLPTVLIDWQNSWNFRQSTLQYSNARLLWTLNEHVAFSLEGRFRSRFDWRKGDHENFVLDVTRSQEELLRSPLSDRRITFLSNLFVRLNPFWECRLQSHHGFYRLDQSPYNELKLDLVTWLSSALKLHLGYKYTDYTKPNFPHHFDVSLELVK